MSNIEDHLTLSEASELLRISTNRVRQFITQGKLEATCEGKRYHVSRASVYARIGQQATPPGVQRTLYFARHFRDLTTVNVAKAGRWGHQAALAQVSAQMFGSEQAEPYRELIRMAAERVLEAGAARDWRALDEARGNLHAVFLEYEFVAAPITPEAKLYEARQSVAVPLFGASEMQ